MMESDTDASTQAWLLCEVILNSARNELITEAMDALNEEIKAKNIEIKGSLINLPDKPSDTDMNMFIINKILEEYQSMKERYSSYLSESNNTNPDPKMIERIEKLRKFLLSVEKIHLLMSYSHVVETWINDVSMDPNLADPVKLLANTMETDTTRPEIVEFMLKSKVVTKEKVFTKEERRVLEEALNEMHKRTS